MSTKNCIVYLLKASEEDMLEFSDSVNSLYNYFLKKNPCDIICFHENDLIPYIDTIRQKLKVNVEFIEISFSIPNNNKHLDIPKFFPHPTHGNGPIAWGHLGFDIGYRHMCRFFSGEIFKQSVLKKYKYYMRMDSDSFILDHVTYNVFDFMEQTNKKYAFIAPAVQFDNPLVCKELWEKSYEWYFNNKEKCILAPITEIPKYKLYYTNFEICDIEWFNSGHYMEYYSYIDYLGGIYTERWGDAVIRYLGVNMFMKDFDKFPIYDIAYKHGAVYNR